MKYAPYRYQFMAPEKVEEMHADSLAQVLNGLLRNKFSNNFNAEPAANEYSGLKVPRPSPPGSIQRVSVNNVWLTPATLPFFNLHGPGSVWPLELGLAA